jgi:hypothetical protein
MGTVQARSLDQPDETRSLANGVVELVTMGGTMLGRARFEPWVTVDFSQEMADYAKPS